MNYSTQTHSHTEYNIKACIAVCCHCHQVCLHTAMNYCLETGGKHVEAEHFRLIMNCAEICHTAAYFQLSSFNFHRRLCKLCAEICESCIESCEKIGGMDDCVEACRECAVSCRQMAGVQYYD